MPAPAPAPAPATSSPKSDDGLGQGAMNFVKGATIFAGACVTTYAVANNATIIGVYCRKYS